MTNPDTLEAGVKAAVERATKAIEPLIFGANYTGRTEDIVRTVLATLPAAGAVPSGWKLVPDKLTPEMIAAVRKNGGMQAAAFAIAAWPDLLAASPPVPSGGPVASVSPSDEWASAHGMDVEYMRRLERGEHLNEHFLAAASPPVPSGGEPEPVAWQSRVWLSDQNKWGEWTLETAPYAPHFPHLRIEDRPLFASPLKPSEAVVEAAVTGKIEAKALEAAVRAIMNGGSYEAMATSAITAYLGAIPAAEPVGYVTDEALKLMRATKYGSGWHYHMFAKEPAANTAVVPIYASPQSSSVTDAQGIEWFERSFRVPLGDMPGRLDVEAMRGRLGARDRKEARCGDCGRHVMADPQAASGFIAKCGKRLTRIEECSEDGCHLAKDLLLKLDEAGTFTTVGGLRARVLQFNATPIDVADAANRTSWLTDGSWIKRVSVAGGGIFKDQASDAAVRSLFFTGAIRNWQLIVPDFGIVEGPFQIVALEFAAGATGEVTFDMALESAGPSKFAIAS